MNYEILVAGMNQDEINEIYINWELRAIKLLIHYALKGRNIRWNPYAKHLYDELIIRNKYLFENHKATSLPF